MPGEVVEEEVDGEVAFPGPEVPGWDRSATAAEVLHDPALPPGVERAPCGTLVLKNALPAQIALVIGSL
jgi:hypothetical protein